MERFTYESNPNYWVRNPKLLYIDRYGNVYPDCKTYKSPIICHITDKDAKSKINESVLGNDDLVFNMITVELSGRCNANCIYCFQHDNNRNKKYRFFNELFELLNQLKTYWLFFSGGEILFQNDSMEFIERYKKKNPDVWVHLKTNGNAGVYEESISFVNKYCDSVMVSFNGFSEATYNTIMRLELSYAINFCETLKRMGNVNVGVKLLISAITIAEIPFFLDWALNQKFKCIALQVAYNYEIDMESGKSNRLNSTLPSSDESQYWMAVYNRVSEEIHKVISEHRMDINCEYNFLTADRELDSVLGLNRDKCLFRTDGVYIIE